MDVLPPEYARGRGVPCNPSIPHAVGLALLVLHGTNAVAIELDTFVHTA